MHQGKSQCDASAKRVADDVRAPNADGVEQIAHVGKQEVGPVMIASDWLIREPVAAEIEAQCVSARTRQRLKREAIRVRARAPTVDEQYRFV
jgi:hypothetical protein